MITRRSFLAALPVAAVALHSLAQSELPQFVYFGTDTSKGSSKGIYRSTFDPSTGTLTPPVLAAETPAPSFLAISPIRNGLRFLFTVNELNGTNGTVTSFAFNPATGALRQLNQVSAAGAGPCYIAVDPTAHSAFVADYAGHALASYRILPNGHLTAPVSLFNCSAPVPCEPHGPNPDRQEASHFHCAILSRDSRFLLVNDLGADTISVYAVDTHTAALTPHQILKVKSGSGPRHVAFHPHHPWVYSINELASTIDRLHWSDSGELTDLKAPVSTLASGFHSQNTAAEIAISADGNFLYASNRGEDSLVVFAIHPADGSLRFLQRIACGGHTPRQFTLDPSGRWLLCGNQTSATITVFRRDPTSGRIAGPTQTLAVNAPQFILFA